MAGEDKAVGGLLVPCAGARLHVGSAAAQEARAVEAAPPPPGWKWNGSDWEYSSRYLNEPHLRAVSEPQDPSGRGGSGAVQDHTSVVSAI